MVPRTYRESIVRVGRALTSPRLLWSVALVAILGDLATTVYGLQNGLRERNPVVAAVFVDHGVAGLVALKLVTLCWVVLVWRGMKRRYGVAAVAGFATPQAAAVGLNVLTILTAS